MHVVRARIECRVESIRLLVRFQLCKIGIVRALTFWETKSYCSTSEALRAWDRGTWTLSNERRKVLALVMLVLIMLGESLKEVNRKEMWRRMREGNRCTEAVKNLVGPTAAAVASRSMMNCGNLAEQGFEERCLVRYLGSSQCSVLLFAFPRREIVAERSSW